MNVLSPTESLEKIVRLFFRIQVKENRIFTRFLRLLRNNGFKIIDFDEFLRRVTGYSTISNIENISKILSDYALSYSFEVTIVLKTRSIRKILDNIKTLLGNKEKEKFITKLYINGKEPVYVFHNRKWWLIKIIGKRNIIKITLLKKPISQLDSIFPYHYTFYDVKEALSMKKEILEDLKDIVSLLQLDIEK